MIESNYGKLPEELIEEYKDRLVGRVYKILPMKEENVGTWNAYIESLLFELVGHKDLIKGLDDNSDFISLLSILEGLIGEEDLTVVRREVFKSLNLIKRI